MILDKETGRKLGYSDEDVIGKAVKEPPVEVIMRNIHSTITSVARRFPGASESVTEKQIKQSVFFAGSRVQLLVQGLSRGPSHPQ